MSAVVKRILFYLGLAVGLLLVLWKCYTGQVEIWKEVFVGLFGSVLLLVVLEIREYFVDRARYGFLSGSYKRVEFNLTDPSRTFDTIYKPVSPFKPEILIVFEYKGGRKYECLVEYPEGPVKSIFFADEANPWKGTGSFEYTSKHSPLATMPDFGDTYYHGGLLDEAQFLYVTHKNVWPSGLSQGIERWEKVK